MVKVGDFVKVYLKPDFGQTDGIVTHVNATSRRINALVPPGNSANCLTYIDDLPDTPVPTQSYWVEAPEGFGRGRVVRSQRGGR